MSPLNVSRNHFSGKLYATGGSCDWCGASLPDAGAFLVAKFDPDGGQFEHDALCSDCYTYGPPQSSRRERVELAWRITPQMGRLERACWWLLRRVSR